MVLAVVDGHSQRLALRPWGARACRLWRCNRLLQGGSLNCDAINDRFGPVFGNSEKGVCVRGALRHGSAASGFLHILNTSLKTRT